MNLKRVVAGAICATALSGTLALVGGQSAEASTSDAEACYAFMRTLGFQPGEAADDQMKEGCDYGQGSGDAYGCSTLYVRPAIVRHNEYGNYIMPAESARACRVAIS